TREEYRDPLSKALMLLIGSTASRHTRWFGSRHLSILVSSFPTHILGAFPITTRFNSLLRRLATWDWQPFCDIQVLHTSMFRISIIDTPSQRKLVVGGTLVGAWVAELCTTWRNVSQDLDGRKLVIDLSNVTVVSHEGENAIFDLMKKGASFSCGGVL